MIKLKIILKKISKKSNILKEKLKIYSNQQIKIKLFLMIKPFLYKEKIKNVKINKNIYM